VLAKGLYASPRVADVTASDMRYISFNTVDMFQVGECGMIMD
jgi:hypothetical protein